MKRLVTGLLTIFFSVCVITGCAQPVGSISNEGGKGNGNGSKDEYDFLMLRPNRILYEVDGGVDGRFDRAADLRVFVADGEGYRAIDTSDPNLKLEIIMNPGMIAESVSVITTHFPFSEPGRHIIKGTYGGETDEYSIEVRGTLVNPGEGSGFIEMIWL